MDVEAEPTLGMEVEDLDELDTSDLFQIPLSPEEVTFYKKPLTQASVGPMNCSYVNQRLLSIISDETVEERSASNLPDTEATVRSFLSYINPINSSTYEIAHSEHPMEMMDTIQPKLYKGFATPLVYYYSTGNGDEVFGHAITLARSPDGRYAILDPQALTVYTDVESAVVGLRMKSLTCYKIDAKSRKQIIDDFSAHLVRQTPIEFAIQESRVHSFDLYNVNQVFIDKVFPILKGCFDVPVQHIQELKATAPNVRRLVCISNTTWEATVANPIRHIRFICIVTKHADGTHYLSHVCVPAPYRSGGYLRKFAHLLGNIGSPKDIYTLIAADTDDRGLNMNTRIRIYSRMGFSVPMDTIVRLRSGVRARIIAIRGRPSNIPGQKFGYVFQKQDGTPTLGYESDIIGSDVPHGCPMVASAEQLGVFSGDVCQRPVGRGSGRKRHTLRRRHTKK